jgi:pimeloyl-ACP methyl ester carboxylesterase
MRVEVNGVRLFFDVEGAKLVPDGPVMRERPTLVLLHGGPGVDHAMGRHMLSPLSDVAQLVFFDMRGHGRSDRSDAEHWNLTQWADDVVGLCDALEIKAPIVMGGSFGGYVALTYATRHPERPSKLIVGSTRATAPDFSRSLRVFERLGGEEARDVARRYFDDASESNFREFVRVCFPLYGRTPQDPDGTRRVIRTPEVLEHFRRGELLQLNLLPLLSTVRCPTLLFGGEDDPMTPIEDQQDIANALPQHLVQFHRIPNAGHGPYRDDPRVLDIIREFIAS